MKIGIIFLIQALSISTVFAQGKSPKIDPKKFTICTITLNSTNERDAFQKNAEKYKGQINPLVELTNFGDGDWFKKACESKIRCDQLIISGHHSSGHFYGDGSKRINDDTLIEAGCSKKCQGIMNKPYEVFMFGCTTMTGTTNIEHDKDRLATLLKVGIPKQKAQQLSELGTSDEGTKQDFKIAFSGAEKRIYGFSKAAPSGQQIDIFIKNYLKNTNPVNHLNKLRADRIARQVTDVNEKLKGYLGHTTLESCNAGEGKDVDVEKLKCQLNSSELNLDQKIELAINAMTHDNFMRYLHEFNRFIYDYSDEFTPAQLKHLDLIKKNAVIKRQVSGVLKKLSAESVRDFSDLVEFGKYINAITPKEMERLEL